MSSRRPAGRAPPPDPADATGHPAYAPHGRALLDHWRGRADAAVVHHCEGHETDVVPAAVYFREVAQLDALERTALDRCRGRVLDVGAAAGAFALPLQARGHAVVALDVAPDCVTVLRERGVRDARCATTADVDDGPFDTVLLLMHGVGIVGTLDGLVTFLADLHRLVARDGRVLLDSAPGAPPEPTVACRYELEYDGARGPPLDWLFVDEGTLVETAAAAGWTSTILARDARGRYLAELTPDA